MKVAVVGKGGVGKTMVAGTLSRLLARDGYRVLAIDADPSMNLPYALGISEETIREVVPICENKTLIEDRTFVLSGQSGILSLTPRVDDLAEKFGVQGPDGIRLIVMGTVRTGGSGCLCPANALIRALIRHLVAERDEAVVMDMEAGLEHLGRSTVRGVNTLVCVLEPGKQSIETARRIVKLAADLGIGNVLAIGNKIMTEYDRVFIERSVESIRVELVSMAPFDRSIAEADMMRVAPLDHSPASDVIEAVRELENCLREKYS